MTLGKLIAIEGIDGSGKTTIVKKLVEYLNMQGIPAVSYSEFNDTELGKSLRPLLTSGEISSLAQLMLVWAARLELSSNHVKQDLENGVVVIMDRYVDSTYAYQGTLHWLPNTVEEIEHQMLHRFKYASVADITLYLAISAKTSVERCNNRNHQTGDTDSFDNFAIEKKKQLIKGFKHRADYVNHVSINAGLPEPAVWNSVKRLMDEYFNIA